MTNQASEDELDEKLTNIIQSVTLEHPAIGEYTLWDISPSVEQDEWGYILFKQLKSLIHTEKLKLLAEVRERVMSEGDFVDAEILKKLYDKAYSNGYNDKGYESLYNSQDYRSAEDIAPVIAKIRGGYDKRSAALTKLEAEL